MIVMESVDSDKLKPYLRGESEGDSMNDPSLLHDSNGSTGVALWPAGKGSCPAQSCPLRQRFRKR